MQLSKTYDHKKEGAIYALWEKAGAFKERGKGKKYTVLMPPPNANASLHAGHAMYTIDDIYTRYKRMQGYDALFIPGMDHAGFETQYVYEKHLKELGKSRMDFDRNTLYKNIFTFVQENSGLIYKQFKKLGFGADWDRSVFTLDKKVVDTVYKTFTKMEKAGLVYRDKYLVNYCTHCGTSLAELEVKHVEKVSPLYFVKYKKVNAPGHIVVATTRIEPIWVDTHLAVNPKDKKNKGLIGTKVLNPLTGKEMEIIGDSFVDPEFGTGIVKLTPAHDPVDFEVAKKRGLPIISAIGMDGKLLEGAGKYAGLYPSEARKVVFADLKDKGLIAKIDETYKNSVITCYKCGNVLEPMTIPNWFIKIQELKKPVIAAVNQNKVSFVPIRHKKTMLNWLTIMHDWPISRQIAWGIRIPAWYDTATNPEIKISFVTKSGKAVTGAAGELLKKYSLTEIKKGLQELVAPEEAAYKISVDSPGNSYLQETDTFDTWFSSGQWPIVTLKEKEFATRFPTDFMGTLSDILKFWISRMILFSIYLKGQVPFKVVYLWSMVADKKGKKMSKSKGNVINPVELIDKYGADALRFSLLYGVPAGSKVILSEEKVRGMRNFANKLWNIARFILLDTKKKGRALKPTPTNKDDKEILARLANLTSRVTKNLDTYNLNDATTLLYDFVWNQFANEYLEKVKTRKEAAAETLKYVLQECITLLHPIMPFVTESIWQAGFSKDPADMLILVTWPK